jgi:group I intron endonuclease
LTDFLHDKNLNPVFCYENLNTEEIKTNIKIQTKGLSGVYLILNKITLDFYIGSASTDRFYVRFSNHLIYFKGSKIVKLAVKKYGISNFAFIVLELFPKIVNKENNKDLLDIEDFYLKSLLPNYNILTEAGSSFGYKHTEISRLKMSNNYSIERRIRIGNLNKNQIFSQETIEKMKEKALNRKKYIYSNDALDNMKKRSKPIILYNLDFTIYGKYSSIIEAAKELKCHDKTIRRSLKSKSKILKRR